jgi:hypothetical protein
MAEFVTTIVRLRLAQLEAVQEDEVDTTTVRSSRGRANIGTGTHD